MGQSGSGKSTLMNILGCLDRPTGGSVPALPAATSRASTRTVSRGSGARRSASCSRATTCWRRRRPRRTSRCRASTPGCRASARGVRAESLLTTLGLGERLDHRPNQLSGGQQQRVSIARALMNGGNVILADEPTGALDSRSGVEVMALLEQLARKGHTVILITHDAEIARHADRIVELGDGRVVRDSGRKPEAADPKRNERAAAAVHEPTRIAVARRDRRSDSHGDALAARQPVPHRPDVARHRDRRRVGGRDARDRSGRAVGRDQTASARSARTCSCCNRRAPRTSGAICRRRWRFPMRTSITGNVPNVL